MFKSIVLRRSDHFAFFTYYSKKKKKLIRIFVGRKDDRGRASWLANAGHFLKKKKFQNLISVPQSTGIEFLNCCSLYTETKVENRPVCITRFPQEGVLHPEDIDRPHFRSRFLLLIMFCIHSNARTCIIITGRLSFIAYENRLQFL